MITSASEAPDKSQLKGELRSKLSTYVQHKNQKTQIMRLGKNWCCTWICVGQERTMYTSIRLTCSNVQRTTTPYHGKTHSGNSPASFRTQKLRRCSSSGHVCNLGIWSEKLNWRWRTDTKQWGSRTLKDAHITSPSRKHTLHRPCCVNWTQEARNQ